jgi:serine protease Do
MKRLGLPVLVLLLVALASMMCMPDRGTSQEKPDSDQPTPPPPVQTDQLAQASQTFVQLAKFASPAVVNIDVTKTVKSGFRGMPRGQDDWFKFFGPRMGPQKDYKQRGMGSGFLIDDKGHIVTNNHVVADADLVKVKLADETVVTAEIVGTDPKTDLALIKIKDEDFKKLGRLPTLPLGDSDALEVGEWVIAIGNPFGFDHTVTAGIVSAKSRALGGSYDDFIQTDAAINPGNSGGPLINTKGEVIGINAMINASGQGIGFAIPSNLAINIIGQLQASGTVTRGWLGVYIQEVTPELAEAFGLDEASGALVAKVFDDSPAVEAGLHREDVILSFNGRKVEKSSELPVIVADTPVGSKVNVEIMRDGKRKTVKVAIGEMPSEQTEPAEKERADFGLTVRNITPDIAQELGVDSGEGVLVTEVTMGSPAQEAGLHRYDVIIEVNRTRISTTETFYKQIENADPEKPILLLVKREDGTFFTAIKP